MKAPIRLVLDTNVVLSALLWGGKPGELLRASATAQVQLFSSQVLLDELEQSLAKPKLANRLRRTGLAAAEWTSSFRALVDLVQHGELESPASRDADDDFVLACALAAKADAIVSGDNDLLVLGVWNDIAILTPNDCLEVVTALQGA